MTRNQLGLKLDEAAKAFNRIMDKQDQMTPDVLTTACAIVLTMHGHLFAEAATAIRTDREPQ